MADFLGLMKQAAELKSKMEAMQAELDQMEVEGTSGGGLVTVKLSGKGEVKGVKIDDTLMQPSEKEILEDLIVAAHADARRKAETLLQDKMKSVAGSSGGTASDGGRPWKKTSMCRLCRPRSRDFWRVTC